MGLATDDALGTGQVAATYHANDLVRAVPRGSGPTHTYTLDVDQQRVRSWSDGTTTRTHHYDADSDSPSWTSEGGSDWTRIIGGIGGDAAAIHDSASGSTALQLTNLRGDIVATAVSTSTTLTATHDYSEFGEARATQPRYGWLGAKRRATDNPGGHRCAGGDGRAPLQPRYRALHPGRTGVRR